METSNIEKLYIDDEKYLTSKEKRRKIDFSKYSLSNSIFKSEKEIDEYMREMREDR